MADQPTMTAEEFRQIQDGLGLADQQMADMLGFENVQHVRRLKAKADASHAKRVMPQTARLMKAYHEGYRPLDWPADIKRRPVEYVTKEDFEATVADLRQEIQIVRLGIPADKKYGMD